MKTLKSIGVRLWKDESGQGTAEYVLILVAIVGGAMLFRGKLSEILTSKMGSLKGLIDGFGTS